MGAIPRRLIAIACVAVFTTTTWCQGNFGGITGRVVDPSGASIAQATVILINLDTSGSTTVATTGDGVYAVSSVSPGRYRISVSDPGFKTFVQEPIIITTATTLALDISLTVGNASETIQVSEEAAGLQTTSAEIGTAMPQQAMLDLPISLGGNATIGASGRRQIENFTFLTPGVQGNQWAKFVDGAPAHTTEALIDGIGMQDIGAPGMIAEASPPYEAVSEFKMQNSLYPAEYGNGLGIQNYTLKSGGSRFHGDAFEFLRNNKLDAAGYFAPQGSETPVLQQNEFGFTFGGPLAIPKIGQNKTFFFGAYSGFRLRGGLPTGSLITLPSVQERSGDFSDYPYPIFDPATTTCAGGVCTRQQFPGNIIPADRISAVASRVLPLIPNPDFPGFQNNYVSRANSPANEDDYSIKIDRILTNNQQLSGAYWKAVENASLNFAVGGEFHLARNTPTRAQGIRLNHTYTISPTLVNHVAFGYTGSKPTWSYWSLDPRHGNEIEKIPGIPPDAPGFPALSVAGYAEFGNADQQGLLNYFQNWAITDDVTWVTGKHTLKVGFMYRHRSMSSNDLRLQAGAFSFSNLSTSQPSDTSNFSVFGNSFASFLLGQVISATRALPPPARVFSDGLSAPYLEDTIKATSKLTFTLGLRYELPNYATEQNGNVSLISLTQPNPAAGNLPGALIFLGKGSGRTGSNNIFGSYHSGFSPRVSLAYSPDTKTVVRMGYGMFLFFPNYGRLEGCNYFCAGFGLQKSLSSTDNGVTPVFQLDQGFPAVSVTLPNLDPSLVNDGAYTHVNAKSNKPATDNSWTLSIQRELPANIILDVAYVGSHTTGLPAGTENLNQVDPKWLSLGNELTLPITCLGDGTCPSSVAAGVTSPYAGFNGSVGQALRPFPQYARIDNFFSPTGYNTYHSLQMRAQKRYSNGLSLLASYTLSKNIGITNGDSFGDIEGGAATFALNTFNPGLERAITPFDQTHVFSFSWSYDLPFGRGKRFLSHSGFVDNYLLGGWQINSIENYSSGNPISIGGGPYLPIFNFGGFGGNRPDWNSAAGSGRSSVSMSDFNPHTDRYLVSAPFSDPAPFTFGDAPPRQPNLRTPFNYNEDFSVIKRVGIGGESRYVEFRAEFFNLFNRVVFGGPNTNVDSPASFGIISSQANTPRVIQFGLKVVF